VSDRQTVAPTTTPITLAEAKAQLNISSTNDDTLIERLTSVAATYLENRCNRAWISQTRQLKFQTFDDERYIHDRTIFLPRSPLSSTSTPSVSYTNSSGTSTAASSTSFIVSYDQPGRISEAYNNTWPATRNVADDVTITYVCGYGTAQSSVPEPVRHAVGMLVAHWYRNREAVGMTMSHEIKLGIDALLADEWVPDYG
jgi:uncharacterized phiE125 gp8 family phage protein